MRKKILVLAVSVFFIFISTPSVSSGGQPNDESSACVSRGYIQFVNSNYDGAISEFTQAVTIDPKNATAYYQRAKVYEYLDKFDDAVKDYCNVINADQTFGSAYYYRGVIYQKQGRLEDAIADYTSIIELKSCIPALKANAYNNRGLAYDRKNQYDQAVADFTNAIDILPDQINAYYNRGLTYINMQLYPLAKADLDKELSQHPDMTIAKHYKLALTYYVANEFEKAYEEILMLENVAEKINPVFIENIKKHLTLKTVEPKK